ncbi:MAG: radical SAM protein [Desulfobacteraceae bacterium]|nr:radical SAM protein [Desulfobacteraceae bacterium]
MTNHKKIGLVELPYMRLYDSQKNNWLSSREIHDPLSSKQILISSLEDGGFDVHLVNLKKGDELVELGNVEWRGKELTKGYSGMKVTGLDYEEYDCWGITINLLLKREVACMLIKHLAAGDKPIVVGGSDAIANPEIYIRAGADAVVLDKSGAVNCSVIDYVLGNPPRQELGKVILADGTRASAKIKVMSPEEWPLPSLETARDCMGGMAYVPEEFLPMASLISDIGCDRNCDFCQTPTYKLGYKSMSPKRVLQWVEIQKKAGAKSISFESDQFLGRLLRSEGRNGIFKILKGMRELELPIIWMSGLELRKLTLGHGKNNDLKPDNELIDAIFEWDGKIGSCLTYIAGERPVAGRENYQKLLPWQEHLRMMRTIVQAGAPIIAYGVIIGFPDESPDTLSSLEDALYELHHELMSINSSLKLMILPFAFSPIPGTVQGINMEKSGLIRFDDPFLSGGFWTPTLDTQYLSYEEISDWQMRLFQINSDFDLRVQHAFSRP